MPATKSLDKNLAHNHVICPILVACSTFQFNKATIVRMRGPARSILSSDRAKPYDHPSSGYRDQNDTTPTVTVKQKAKFKRFQNIHEVQDDHAHVEMLELLGDRRFKYLQLLNDHLEVLRKECMEMMAHPDTTPTTEYRSPSLSSSFLQMDWDLEMLSKVCETKPENLYDRATVCFAAAAYLHTFTKRAVDIPSRSTEDRMRILKHAEKLFHDSQQTSAHEEQFQSTPTRSATTKERFLAASRRQVAPSRERSSVLPETPTKSNHMPLPSSNLPEIITPPAAHTANPIANALPGLSLLAPWPTDGVITPGAVNNTSFWPTQIPGSFDSLRTVLSSDIDFWIAFPRFLIDRIFVINSVRVKVINHQGYYRQFLVQFGDLGSMGFVSTDEFFGLLGNIDNDVKMYCTFYW